MLEYSEITNIVDELLKHKYLDYETVRGGFRVISRTSKGVKEIFERKFKIEEKSQFKKIKDNFGETKITDEDISLLEANNRLEQELVISLESDKSTHSYKEGDILNLEFHLTIARASGNNRLADMVEKLLNEVELFLGYDPYIARLDVAAAAANQHYEIIERLRCRDKLGAQEAMKKHIENAKNNSLNRF